MDIFLSEGERCEGGPLSIILSFLDIQTLLKTIQFVNIAFFNSTKIALLFFRPLQKRIFKYSHYTYSKKNVFEVMSGFQYFEIKFIEEKLFPLCSNIEFIKEMIKKHQYMLKFMDFKDGIFKHKWEIGSKILSIACENGKFENLCFFCDTYEEFPDKYNFIKACKNGYEDIVKYLLSKEVFKMKFIKKRDLDSAFFDSIKYSHFKLVKILLKEDVSIKSDYQRDAFVTCCETGNLKIVKLLSEFKKDEIDINFNNSLALRKATFHENNSVVKFLIDKYKDIKIKDSFLIAVKINNIDLVKLYLENEGNKINDEIKHKAIEYGCLKGNVDVINLVIKNGIDFKQIDTENSIFNACLKGNEKIVSLLLSHGIKASSSCLKVACKKGYENIVKILLKEIKPNVNGDCLVGACLNGHNKIVQILLDKLGNNHPIYMKAIRFALKSKHFDVVKLVKKKLINTV